MRLFVAVEPPAEALDQLAAFTAGLEVVRTGTRVTARHLWHVTLAFLGEVPEERVAAMALQGPLRYRRRNDSLQVMEKSVERELKWRTRNPTLRKTRNGLRFLFRYVL